METLDTGYYRCWKYSPQKSYQVALWIAFMNDNFILQKICPMRGNFILDPIFAGKDKWITNLEINACSDDHTLFVRKKVEVVIYACFCL